MKVDVFRTVVKGLEMEMKWNITMLDMENCLSSVMPVFINILLDLLRRYASRNVKERSSTLSSSRDMFELLSLLPTSVPVHVD